MAVKISGNPTLQVVWLPKTRRMDEAMGDIRETHTLGQKRDKQPSKSNKTVFDHEKFNMLLKKSLSESKRKGARNHREEKDPLDVIDFQKQLDEIEILVDIIKRTGNATQKRSHTSLVHVPLPKEFYQLKPLVRFKTSATKPKRRDVGVRESSREPIQLPSSRNVVSARTHEVPTLPPLPLLSERKVVSQPVEKISEVKTQKIRVDKSTLTSVRGKTTVDKSTLTSSRLLSVREKDEPKVETVVEKPKEVVITIEKEVQKAENEFDTFQKRVLREMSTIGSDPAPDSEMPMSTYESFDIVSYTDDVNDPVDEGDLRLVDNSWTVLDLHTDPLENAKQVIVRPRSPSTQIKTNGVVLDDKIEVQKEEPKKVTYSDEPPELHMSKVHEYKAESASSSDLSNEEEKLLNGKHDEIKEPEPERPKTPEKSKHKRSKSHKRSKKSLPNVHLSDYKGFYVVHTTNDWSFS